MINGNKRSEIGLTFSVIFILLFTSTLILLILQIYRTIIQQRKRGVSHYLFWVRLLNNNKIHPNIHLILKSFFAFICFVRILQGLLFIVSSSSHHPVFDISSHYYVPYILSNVHFTCFTILLYYWTELGLIAVYKLGKKDRIVPLPLTIGFVLLNLFFHSTTFVILAFINSSESLFESYRPSHMALSLKEIHLYLINIPQFLFIFFAIGFAKYIMNRLPSKLGSITVEGIHPFIIRAYRKMAKYCVIAVIAFGISLGCEFIATYSDPGFIISPIGITLIFIWNALPDVLLIGALLGLTWMKNKTQDWSHNQFASDLLESDVTRDGSGEDEEEMI